MTFFENSHEPVNGDGDPHLDTHGVLRSAVEGLDSQMLFDPFEEEFNVPTAAVKLGDGVVTSDRFLRSSPPLC